MERKFTVYINENYDGLAIFATDNVENDCLYFTAWFDKEELTMLLKLSNEEKYAEIEKYLEDCESWEGNDPDMKSYDQFSNLNDFENWVRLY